MRAGFLIDALGNCHHVRLLFAGVRGEFLLDRFRRNSYRCNRMLCVSQHADDFRRQHSLQDLYRFLDVSLICRRHRALRQAFLARSRKVSISERKGFGGDIVMLANAFCLCEALLS